MLSDDAVINMAVTSVILGLLAVLVVGSQSAADARFVTIWSLFVLVPMLLLSCACIVFSDPSRRNSYYSGKVVLCIVMILSVRLGYQIARSRKIIPNHKIESKPREALPLEDELGT